MAYQIDWKGSPNFRPGRAGNKPIAIVNHIMQGTMESTLGWFQNPDNEVSSHYAVSQDGRRIWQYVRDENTAWANGVNWATNPKINEGIDWLRVARNRSTDVNSLTISIEHEGWTGKVFPEEQYQATLWLHKEIIKKWGIAIDNTHIIKHGDIDGINRPYCPGVTFPWERLFNDLKAWASPPPPSNVVNLNGFEVNDEYGFYTEWKKRGEIGGDGYPVSGAVYDPGLDAVVQYFERARYEKRANLNYVQRGLVGRELLEMLRQQHQISY